MHLDAEALFRAHAPFVAAFLRHLGVQASSLDDALQEVFLVAHRRGGFDVGPARPTTWLAEIAFRVASDRRAVERTRERASGTNFRGDVHVETPFEAVSTAQSLALVERALHALSPLHRAVLVLYEIEDESCEDIAAAFGIPLGTVHSRLHHARRELRVEFDRLIKEDRDSERSCAGGRR